MPGKYLSAVGAVTLCSVVFWAGCSSDGASPIPGPSDGGGDPTTGTDGGANNTDPGNGGNGGDPQQTPGPSGGTDGGSQTGPQEVPFTYGACPAPTPCGGDPKGTWKYVEGGCVAEVTSAQCPDLTITNNSIKARGTLTIGATTLERNVEATTTATVQIPPSCTQGQSCGLAQAYLTAKPPLGLGMFDKATCKNGAAEGSCECEVSKKLTDKSSTTYTVDGNTISTADGKSYDFCVANNKMTYRDKYAGFLDATFVMSK